MFVDENDVIVKSNKKPSSGISDGFGGKYILLLERTVANLEAKIAELTREP